MVLSSDELARHTSGALLCSDAHAPLSALREACPELRFRSAPRSSRIALVQARLMFNYYHGFVVGAQRG